MRYFSVEPGGASARLQEYGTPGGTLLSGEAAGLLPEARRRGLRDLGVLPMRGLPRSLRAYSIDPPGGVAVPVKPAPGHLPSLAVLPLLNLSGDPLDEYFATGIMEDVVASLSGLGELFIVAPDSARMFAGQNPSPQRAARTLGVRFIVSGGLRRSGNPGFCGCPESTILPRTGDTHDWRSRERRWPRPDRTRRRASDQKGAGA